MLQTQPAGENRWWPLLLGLGLALGLLALAFVLQAHRDFGAGVIASRPGPARGNMRSVSALVIRLNRAPLSTWAVAFVVLGFVFGYLATSVKDLLSKETGVQQILAAGAATPAELVHAFLVTILSLVGIIAAISGVQVMTRVRAEELEDRVDPILAMPVGRPRYYGASVALALVAPAVYLLVAATIIGLIAANGNTGLSVTDVFLQALATVPAVWVLVAVSVAVIGARPHVGIAAWAGVVASFALTILGPTFKLWSWVLAISPFWHVPKVTAASPDWWGIGGIGAVALILLAIGFAGFRRRDIAV